MILRRNALLLSLGVSVAFVSRLITNVLTRPEFVGWFNHSTYYWVQARSLIYDGQLAYEDMPLLFVLYAKLALLGSWAGLPLTDAIVTSSRLVMAVTPALIPVAMYCLARRANGDGNFRWPTWCLIFASGFLPLTYANMPETLQKNMLGLLLLAAALVVVFRWLGNKSIRSLATATVLAAAIVFAHLGSALAALLLVVSVTLERLFSASSPGTRLWPVLLSALIASLFLLAIGLLYPGSMNRVQGMANAFVPDSIVSGIAMLAVLAAWLAAAWFILRWMSRKFSGSDPVVLNLMRILVLWIGLLAMPLWPGEIGMRLLLFTPLGFVVLLLLLHSQLSNARLLTFVSAATATVFCLMSVGEAVSMFMIYPNKDEISAELSNVKEKYQLVQDDLVITPYGVNPTANWFLGTKASLLTAVTQNDVANYERVFILNTLERPAPVIEVDECKSVTTENDRYWTTRHDIPLGEHVADSEFQTFAFFELDALPANWVFDDNGDWSGWGTCE